ncbi:hypothetical protein MG293_010960 [Ovis ammon polii]|uniref:Uncharacterized protein n=1 Tax=Ovis ammon polii TaxID=230172 RepID=A0AAD4Y8Q1_OVIAM|nr:hypothetical protein MG293_010960 [Ovis ammon polii]
MISRKTEESKERNWKRSIWGLKIEMSGVTRFLDVPGLGKPVMNLITCDTSVHVSTPVYVRVCLIVMAKDKRTLYGVWQKCVQELESSLQRNCKRIEIQREKANQARDTVGQDKKTEIEKPSTSSKKCMHYMQNLETELGKTPKSRVSRPYMDIFDFNKVDFKKEDVT